MEEKNGRRFLPSLGNVIAVIALIAGGVVSYSTLQADAREVKIRVEQLEKTDSQRQSAYTEYRQELRGELKEVKQDVKEVNQKIDKILQEVIKNGNNERRR